MEFKVGGHRLDPKNINYNIFNKSLFGDSNPIYSKDNADLRPFSSPRHNQRQTSTCTCQSTIKAIEIKHIQKHGLASHIPLSVMDLYWGARDKMDPKETNVDQGTYIHLVCQVLKDFGVCREVMNPFDEKNLFVATPILATREAYLNKIVNSYRIENTGNSLIESVISNLQMGNPVVFGTNVDQNWFDYNNKSAPLTPVKPANNKGGHAICLVGWVDGKFIIENSWGTEWGDNGYAWLQPEVISDEASNDFWVVISGSELYLDG